MRLKHVNNTITLKHGILMHLLVTKIRNGKI